MKDFFMMRILISFFAGIITIILCVSQIHGGELIPFPQDNNSSVKYVPENRLEVSSEFMEDVAKLNCKELQYLKEKLLKEVNKKGPRVLQYTYMLNYLVKKINDCSESKKNEDVQ